DPQRAKNKKRSGNLPPFSRLGPCIHNRTRVRDRSCDCRGQRSSHRSEEKSQLRLATGVLRFALTQLEGGPWSHRSRHRLLFRFVLNVSVCARASEDVLQAIFDFVPPVFVHLLALCLLLQHHRKRPRKRPRTRPCVRIVERHAPFDDARRNRGEAFGHFEMFAPRKALRAVKFVVSMTSELPSYHPADGGLIRL